MLPSLSWNRDMDLKHESPSAAAMMFRGGGSAKLTEGLLRLHEDNPGPLMLKTEPRTSSPPCGEPTTSKRVRLNQEQDNSWLPSPGQTSLDPMSPSSTFPSGSLGPGGNMQGYHSTSALSNGYSSPLSSGSYDPYSPNGKIGEYT